MSEVDTSTTLGGLQQKSALEAEKGQQTDAPAVLEDTAEPSAQAPSEAPPATAERTPLHVAWQAAWDAWEREGTQLAVALALAACGYKVFPCHERNDLRKGTAGAKRPYDIAKTNPDVPPGVGGHLAASANPELIEAWWSKWKAAMVGVPCAANGFAVVDVDVPEGGHEDGRPALQALLDENAATLPDTPRVRTPSGGYHFAFELTEPVPAEGLKDELGPGLDFKANGYVFAPGSTRTDILGKALKERKEREAQGGGQEQEQEPLPFPGTYALETPCEQTAPLPRYIWERVQKNLKPVPAPAAAPALPLRKTKSDRPAAEGTADTAWAWAAIERICDEIRTEPRGNRNRGHNRHFFKAGQKAHYLSAGEVAEAKRKLFAAARENPDPLEIGEAALEKFVERAFTAGEARPSYRGRRESPDFELPPALAGLDTLFDAAVQERQAPLEARQAPDEQPAVAAPQDAPHASPDAQPTAEGTVDGPIVLDTTAALDAFFVKLRREISSKSLTAVTFRGREIVVPMDQALSWCEGGGKDLKARDALWTFCGAARGLKEDGRPYGNVDNQEVLFDRASGILYPWDDKWARDKSDISNDIFNPIDDLICRFAGLHGGVVTKMARAMQDTMNALHASLDEETDPRKQEKLNRLIATVTNRFEKETKRLQQELGGFKAFHEKLLEGQFREKACKAAWKGKGSLGDAGEDWDTPAAVAYTVPVGNGLLRIQEDGTARLVPDHQSHRYLMRTPVNWKEDAVSEKWEKFVSDIMGGDAETIEYLQVCCGAALCRDGRNPAIFIFWGGGSNGKSTFTQVAGAALGDLYFGGAQTGLLLANGAIDNPNGPSPAVLQLRGKAMIVFDELKEKATLDPAKLKQLCAGSELTARMLYSNEILHFFTTGMLFVCTNVMPNLTEHDFGTRRRLVRLPFLQHFFDNPTAGQKQKDPTLTTTLKQPEELEGILAWFVRGACKYRKLGKLPPMPPAVREATSDWVGGTDILRTFVVECLELPQGGNPNDFTVKTDAVFNAYLRWCGESNIMKPLKKPDFFRNLYQMVDLNTEEKMFSDRRTKSSRLVVGGKLKHPEYGEPYGSLLLKGGGSRG